MSIETALAALNTAPAPAATPAAPQQQSLTPQEVTAAASEAETKLNNGAQSTAADSKPSGVEADAKSVPTAEAKKEEPLSAKFSALAKKEKSIVQRNQELKTRESTLTEREAAINAREAKIKQSEELWDKDVFKAIEARGYSYAKLTDLMLEGKTVAPESQDPAVIAKKTIDDFKKEMAQRDEEQKASAKKAQEEATAKQKAELEAAWEAYNNEVNEFVEANKDDYELTNTYNQQALIAETVDAFYQKNQRVLSVKEAADMVEAYLESEAEKALNTKKIGGKVTKNAAPTKETAPEPKQTKTLNNTMQPTSASVLPAQSESDRMKRAMAALTNAEKR